MTRSPAASVFVALGALGALTTCGPSVGTPDADVDASAALDADMVADAGPWEPAFEPRVVFSDPSVTCTPLDYTFRPTPRPPAPMGDLVWSYDFSEDPEVAEEIVRMIGPEASFVVRSIPMTVSTDGGMFSMVGRGTLLAHSGDGAYRGLHTWGTVTTPLEMRQPNWLPALAPDEDLFVPDRETARLSRISFGRTSTPPALIFSLPPGVETPIVTPSALDQGATVMEDGTIVWTLGRDRVVATCADGRTRWVVEHDTDPEMGFGPETYALRDGSIMLFQAGGMIHLAGDGAFLGYAPYRAIAGSTGLVDGCGYYQLVAIGDRSALERYDLSTLSLMATIPINGYWAVAPDCTLFTVEYLESGLRGVISRLEPDGAVRWTHDLPFRPQRGIVPLVDGGVAIVPAFGFSHGCTMGIYDGDGTLRSAEDCSGVLPAIQTYAWRPDGVLVAAYEGDDYPHYAAIELGGLPASTAWAFQGSTWANNRALWMLPAP